MIVRSRVSACFPLCDGGIPRWSSINLQVDNHFLKFCAIGLAHLLLHEPLGTLIPYFIVRTLCGSRMSWTSEASTNVSPFTMFAKISRIFATKSCFSRALPYESEQRG